MHHHQSGWFVGRDVPQHLPQATTAEGVLAMGADAGAAAKQRGETGDAVAFARARARKASLKLVPFFRRTPATMKFDSTAEGIAISSQGLLSNINTFCAFVRLREKTYNVSFLSGLVKN